MRTTHLAAAVAFAALLGTGATAQRTWIVDAQNGAGTDFTDLPPAVAQAKPWDTILVRATGQYSPTTIEKALTILGRGGRASTTKLSVIRLPAGECVVLKHLDVVDFNVSWNLGPVAIEDTALGGPNATILNNGPVTLTDCALALDQALLVQMTALTIVRCKLDGRESTIEVKAAMLSIVDSTLQGGRQGPLCDPKSACGNGTAHYAHPAIRCDAAQITVSGPNTRIAGATTCGGANCACCSTECGITGNGLVEVDPSTPLTQVSAGMSLRTHSVPALAGSGRPPGQTQTLDLYGPPGAAAALVASLPTPASVPLWNGHVWIDPAESVLIHVGVVPQNGKMPISVKVPAMLPDGLPLLFQAALAGREFAVSLPLTTVAD